MLLREVYWVHHFGPTLTPNKNLTNTVTEFEDQTRSPQITEELLQVGYVITKWKLRPFTEFWVLKCLVVAQSEVPVRYHSSADTHYCPDLPCLHPQLHLSILNQGFISKVPGIGHFIWKDILESQTAKTVFSVYLFMSERLGITLKQWRALQKLYTRLALT